MIWSGVPKKSAFIANKSLTMLPFALIWLAFDSMFIITAFLDIENCYQVYPKIQKVVMDIQTDIEFPNNLRPENNDGYNTKYNSRF